MSTVTGEYALNFTGQSPDNPFSNANFTDLIAGNGQILDGLFQHISYNDCLYAYTGDTYDGGNVISKIEAAACGAGDKVFVGCLDENGDGAVAEMNGTSVVVSQRDNYAVTDYFGTATLGSFTANDAFTLELTKGSPNTVALKQNGTTVTLSTSTFTATLSNVRAVFGLGPQNSGACSIKSFAVDGLDTGGAVPILMGQTVF